MPTTPAVQLDRVTLSYTPGMPAVTDVTVELRAGQGLALIGPNGAGKSTLLRGMLGLVPVTAGTLRVLGEEPTSARHRIGYMPQTDRIDPDFPVTVRQVVMMGRNRRIGWLRWPGREDREAVAEALRIVGLDDRARARFGELSGGQRQRAILARAIACRPELLLLDEPFNGLDAESRASLIDLVNDLKASGIAVVMSTHDISLAQQAADLVLLVNREQVAFGPTTDTLKLDLLARAHPGVGIEIDEHTLHVPGHEGH